MLMCFNEKYEMYLEDLQEGISRSEELEIKLIENLNESLEKLYSNIDIDENIKYLINELLEDKEHLDAFLAVTVKRPY